jgi:hypothetical protein
MKLMTIGMFAAILLISLGITAWAARRTRTTAASTRPERG